MVSLRSQIGELMVVDVMYFGNYDFMGCTIMRVCALNSILKTMYDLSCADTMYVFILITVVIIIVVVVQGNYFLALSNEHVQGA